MRIGKTEVKRRVWVGLASALGVTCVWWAWTRARPQVVTAAVQTKPPFVQLAEAGNGAAAQLLRERADLFDPTPLFFPTEWNFGQRPLPDSMQRQPGQVFGSFDANFTFGEQNIKTYASEPVAIVEQPVDILVQGNETPFAGMGQIDIQRPALPARDAFLEIMNLRDGKIIIAQMLNGLTMPRLDFVPMEFLIVVGSSGIIGEPVLMTESGLDEVDEEVDAFFRSYLVKSFHLGERLVPGRYRVLIGP